jgi:hypothetical protein
MWAARDEQHICPTTTHPCIKETDSSQRVKKDSRDKEVMEFTFSVWDKSANILVFHITSHIAMSNGSERINH